MIKVTFTLDDDSVAHLERMSDRFGMPKSQVVREAIRVYNEHMARLSSEERDRLLEIFDDVTAGIPSRPRADVEREIVDIRKARRRGGRGGGEPDEP